MARDLMTYFRAEARDLLTRLSGDTLSFESQPSAELMARLLRHAHTLKGAARVVEQPAIADAIHRFEGLLSAHRDNPESFPGASINELLACLDDISVLVAALETPAAVAPPPAAPDPRAVAAAFSSTTGAEETSLGLYPGLQVDALLQDLRAAAGGIEVLRRNLQSLERHQSLGELLVSQLTSDSASQSARFVAEELQAQLRSSERNLTFGVDLMERELRQVQEATEKLRLVRAEVLFPVLRRALRDACEQSGHLQAELVGFGGDLRLDPQLVGAVQGALIQAVRNCVAHGIEPAQERTAKGKPAAATISLQISRQGRSVVFRCRDDGRGVDIEAVRRGLRTKGTRVAEMDDQQILSRLMRSGLSTAKSVSQTAGRGIGLDLIRETASMLGGEAELKTVADQYTELVLSLPWSVAGGEFLEVAAHSEEATSPLLLPLDSVRAALRLRCEEVSREVGGQTIVHEGQAVPILSLNALIGEPEWPGSRAAVVLRSSQGDLALAVGTLRGTRTASLLPLPPWAKAAGYVAGAALDADGNAQLVLDPDGLYQETRRAGPNSWTASSRTVRLLVIDDSLTTRMLQQSILESAGFEVELASSAEEGLERALRSSGEHDLILCDVEMPGIDGFTFVERLRSDPASRHIPIILVTSRDAPEDKLRGQAVGAQGYIVKSQFDQKDLLRQIRGLLA